MMVRRKTRQLTPVGGALQTVFARLGLSARLAQERALVIWPDVVGAQIAGATRPLRVRDGVLFVATKSSVWSHELILRKPAIMDALRKELGDGVISDIRFVARGYQEESAPEAARKPFLPGPEEWQRVDLSSEDRGAIERILAPVDDPELRAIMERVVVHGRRVRRWQEEQGWRPCGSCGLPHQGGTDLCGVCRPRQVAP